MDGALSRHDWLATWMAAVVAGLCAVIVGVFYIPAYDGVDQNGYLCTARRLVLNHDSAKYTAHPLEYVSDNVVQTGDGVFYAKYPLGYPWLCAVGFWLAGPTGAFWVSPLLAVAGVWGIFLLSRALTNPFMGVLAAILLATNPWQLVFGIWSSSHAAASTFAVWAMYFLWRWGERGGWGNAVATGMLTAYTYTIRYSEALLVFPVLAIVAWRCFAKVPVDERKHRYAEVAGMTLAGLVTVLPLLVHHWIAFGAPFRTGYELCGESTGFSWAWFQEHWWLTLTKMNGTGLAFIFPIGLAGLAYVAVHDRRRASLLGCWCVPPLLLYTAYYWALDREGAFYVRFFASVFPALIICALIFLSEGVQSGPRWSVALGTLVAIAATFNLRTAVIELAKDTDRLQGVQTMCSTVRRHVPDGAIIVAGAGALNSLEFMGNYELYSGETFDRNLLTWRTGTLKKPGPHPFQLRKAEDLDRTLGRLNSRQLAALEQSILVSNLAAGRMVAAITTPAGLHSFRGRMGNEFTYEPLTEWYQAVDGPNNELRMTLFALYRLQRRRQNIPSVESMATLEEQADRQQFRIATLREEYDDRFPGARQKWNEITDVERQLRELRDRARH